MVVDEGIRSAFVATQAQAWAKAEENALARGAHAGFVGDRIYSVRTELRSFYSVEVTDYGKVVYCRNLTNGQICRGWEIYISALQDGIVRTPCYHAARALMEYRREHENGTDAGNA